MRQSVVGVAFATLLCMTGCAPGQMRLPGLWTRDGRGVLSGPIPLTPAQSRRLKAGVFKVSRLDDAAAAALNAGRYAEAEGDTRRSMAVGVGVWWAPELLAQALNAQGKTQQALQAYQRLSGTDQPRNLLPYALLLLKTGHWAQAVSAYNKQLPYLNNGDLMRANSHFSPDVPQPRDLATAVHIGLGLTGDFRGNHWTRDAGDPTLSEFRKALALEPDSPLAHFYYGYGLRQLGRRDEAQAAFAKAAQLGGDDVKDAVKRFSR